MIRRALVLVPLAIKQLLRHRIRTLLTLIGIGGGMFLYGVVENMRRSVEDATKGQANESTLVVFRENRFCPTTSRLPEYYEDEIRSIPGVREVIPIQITVNNCSDSLDIVTFRGVPPENLIRYTPDLTLLAGSLSAWRSRDDGALIGEFFASRRGLSVGDSFEAAGVRVHVEGIFSSNLAQENAVAYVHLPFLQQTGRGGLGIVTQFNVRVDDSSQLETVAEAIDERFAGAEEPTFTQPASAFFTQAAGDLLELLDLTRWVALGAVIAVLGLIANAILLVVRSRVKENAILQTLGYPAAAIAWLVLLEGALLGATGGIIGLGLGALALRFSTLTFGNEGQLLTIIPSAEVFFLGMTVALGLGLFASLVPALTAARQPILKSLQE